jgi:hypothetical protein
MSQCGPDALRENTHGAPPIAGEHSLPASSGGRLTGSARSPSTALALRRRLGRGPGLSILSPSQASALRPCGRCARVEGQVHTAWAWWRATGSTHPPVACSTVGPKGRGLDAGIAPRQLLLRARLRATCPTDITGTCVTTSCDRLDELPVTRRPVAVASGARGAAPNFGALAPSSQRNAPSARQRTPPDEPIAPVYAHNIVHP